MKTAPTVSAAIVAKSIEKESKPLIRLASIDILTQEDFDRAAEALSNLKQLSKKAKAEEATIVDPIRQAIKATQAHFKPFIDLVAKIEAQTKESMTAFLVKQKGRVAQLEEDFDTGKIKKVSTLVRKQNELQVSSEHAQVKRIWQLRIVDENKIPREYLVVDETKVREALKDGKKVPGCVWEQVDSIAI